MKLNIFLLVVLSLISDSLQGQQSIYGRSYENELPAKYILNIPEMREHIFSDIPQKFKDEDERMTYRFADQQAFYISRRISSGTVYSDWTELESYVNGILKKVIPSELSDNEVIHAYLVRDGSFNAYMTPSGHMFIHIGVFSHITDESTLAFILAHEVAHYFKQHSLVDYIKRETEGKPTNKERRNNSIDHELESDRLAMAWLLNSGYNISGIHKAIRIMKRIDDKYIRSLEDVTELEETTHPNSEKRMKQVNDFYKENVIKEAPNFILGEEKFLKFKAECEIEILKAHLNDFNYDSCIEDAFKFHIFNPDNVGYVYYLLEAIRRKCYLDTPLWTANFITDNYYTPEQHTDSYSTIGKEKMTSHFFEKFELELMAIAPKEASKIKAQFYWKGEPKFITYEQAFEFYYKVGEVMKCKECVLTNALSQTKDKELREDFLRKYIGYDGVKHKQFAQKLLKDRLLNTLDDKKLLVFNNFYIYVSQGQERIPIRIQSDDDDEYLSELFEEVVEKFPDRIPVYLPKLRRSKLNDFEIFNALKEFSYMRMISRGELAVLHILNPEYYLLFERYGVNEVEFISCAYGEYRKKEKTLESYKELTTMNYKTIFGQVDRTRYMEVGITSVREREKGNLKIRHYGGENKLDFKTDGKTEIRSEIISQIVNKDNKAAKKDQFFGTKYQSY